MPSSRDCTFYLRSTTMRWRFEFLMPCNDAKGKELYKGTRCASNRIWSCQQGGVGNHRGVGRAGTGGNRCVRCYERTFVCSLDGMVLLFFFPLLFFSFIHSSISFLLLFPFFIHMYFIIGAFKAIPIPERNVQSREGARGRGKGPERESEAPPQILEQRLQTEPNVAEVSRGLWRDWDGVVGRVCWMLNVGRVPLIVDHWSLDINCANPYVRGCQQSALITT